MGENNSTKYFYSTKDSRAGWRFCPEIFFGCTVCHIFYAASTPVLRAGYGQGNDPIVLDDLRCNGRENRLIDCPKRAIGTHNCFHSKDAGVICAPLFIPGPGMLECWFRNGAAWGYWMLTIHYGRCYLCHWRRETCWRQQPSRRTLGGLLLQPVGHNLQWFMGTKWGWSYLWTAWLF